MTGQTEIVSRFTSWCRLSTLRHQDGGRPEPLAGSDGAPRLLQLQRHAAQPESLQLLAHTRSVASFPPPTLPPAPLSLSLSSPPTPTPPPLCHTCSPLAAVWTPGVNRLPPFALSPPVFFFFNPPPLLFPSSLSPSGSEPLLPTRAATRCTGEKKNASV